jgi:hypothetical protein
VAIDDSGKCNRYDSYTCACTLQPASDSAVGAGAAGIMSCDCAVCRAGGRCRLLTADNDGIVTVRHTHCCGGKEQRVNAIHANDSINVNSYTPGEDVAGMSDYTCFTCKTDPCSCNAVLSRNEDSLDQVRKPCPRCKCEGCICKGVIGLGRPAWGTSSGWTMMQALVCLLAITMPIAGARAGHVCDASGQPDCSALQKAPALIQYRAPPVIPMVRPARVLASSGPRNGLQCEAFTFVEQGRCTDNHVRISADACRRAECWQIWCQEQGPQCNCQCVSSPERHD